jgi:Flp pilus assembly pilin Flp
MQGLYRKQANVARNKNMKIVTQKRALHGIAMTEYLIILAVVAVAAILIVGLFGQQIKNVFSENTSALAGVSTGNTTATSIAGNASGAVKQDNMGTFTSGASTANGP